MMHNSNALSVILPDRACLRLEGEDRFSLLQGLVTNDVERLKDQAAIFTGLLSPQGKILFDFFIVAVGVEAFVIDCPAENAADLLKRLNFYKLRAKVTLEDVSDRLTVGAAWGADGAAFARSHAVLVCDDPRLAALGARALVAKENAAAFGPAADDAVYTAWRVHNAVPQSGADYALGDAFPHEACFDLLHGVDFKKGCYVGQEVVSRMHHRGTARTRIVCVSAQSLLPQTRGEIAADGFVIGKLGSVAQRHGLGLVRIDRAAQALMEGQRLHVGDLDVSLTVPPWASYSLQAQSSKTDTSS